MERTGSQRPWFGGGTLEHALDERGRGRAAVAAPLAARRRRARSIAGGARRARARTPAALHALPEASPEIVPPVLDPALPLPPPFARGDRG